MRRMKGVLFTFLTFLFIGVILTMMVFTIDQNNRSSTSTVEISALNAINAKYDDITDDIITLDHPIGIPSIHQRLLPFTYTVDKNTLNVMQTLPLTSGKLALYFDIINAYAIFVKDANTQHTYDGVNVTLDVPKPSVWGGSANGAGFNLLPQCVQYRLIDSNRVGLDSNSTIGCANTFVMNTDVKRVDVIVSLPAGADDYNSVTCDFAGGCPHQDYNSELGLPYFTLRFLDSNCSKCALSSLDKNLSGHFSGNDWNSITYACAGAACASPSFQVRLGSGIEFSHATTPLMLDMSVVFRQDVSTFYFQDANYTVTKPGFDTYKQNVVVFPQ